MARNRVIYQSEALFVSPNATGAHYVLKKIKSYDGFVEEIGLHQPPGAMVSNLED